MNICSELNQPLLLCEGRPLQTIRFLLHSTILHFTAECKLISKSIDMNVNSIDTNITSTYISKSCKILSPRFIIKLLSALCTIMLTNITESKNHLQSLFLNIFAIIFEYFCNHLKFTKIQTFKKKRL